MKTNHLYNGAEWRRGNVLLFGLMVCGLAAIPLLHAHAAGRKPTPRRQATISVETDLVVLPVRVTDAQGNFVGGLTQDQFRVYDEGKPARLTLFRQEDTPVTVGLIVDHSRSMAPKLADVAESVGSFAASSNPGDEMFVVDFSDKVVVELPGGKPFTNSSQDLARAIEAVSANGMTALYDAVAEGLIHLQSGHLDKKALIIVSDGGDNASGRKYAQVLELAHRSQAVIYAIGLVGSREEAEQNPEILRRLCRDTGGLAFFPAEGESIPGVMRKIARDLREQYTMGFVPQEKDHGAFRKVRVEIAPSGPRKLQVRTRAGYYLDPAKAAPANGNEDHS